MRYVLDQLTALIGGTITAAVLVKVTDDGALETVNRPNDADYPAFVVQFPDGESVLCTIQQDEEGNGPGAVSLESWAP